ncbi:MAG: DUF898 family protein [Rhodospirillales bacterium]|nr:DUF898 family protein [Rhodospirillales bacterium]
MVERKQRRSQATRRHDLEDFTDVRPAPVAAEQPAATPEQSAEQTTAEFSFTGRRGELVKIALVNSLANLLTLGLYRFWAKTRLRRYFWSNIRIANEPLEYTGSAMELLTGFLVMLAILVPVFAVPQGALFFAKSTPDWITSGLGFFCGFALLALFQYGFYRIWRYRFSRTNWRGIGFRQSGSAWAYMGMTLGWLLVSITTLGLAYPWLRNAQWKYRMNNLYVGQVKAGYTGKATGLFKKWLIVYVLPVVIVGTAAFINSGPLIEFIEGIDQLLAPESTRENIRQVMLEFITELLPFLFVLLAAVLFFFAALVLYRIFELGFVFNHTHLGNATFTATLKPATVLGFYILMILCSLILFCLLVLMAAFAAPTLIEALGETDASLTQQYIRLVPYLAPLLIFTWYFVSSSLISVIIIHFGTVRHICARLRLKNMVALEQSTRSPNQPPQFGEGLADALV